MNHSGLRITYKIILVQLCKEQYKNYSLFHVKDLTYKSSSLLQVSYRHYENSTTQEKILLKSAAYILSNLICGIS
jgi:hypothetical protein